MALLTYPLTLVEADGDSTLELHVGAVRELECSELGCQHVTVRSYEVVEQVRVYRTAGIRKYIDIDIWVTGTELYF